MRQDNHKASRDAKPFAQNICQFHSMHAPGHPTCLITPDNVHTPAPAPSHPCLPVVNFTQNALSALKQRRPRALLSVENISTMSRLMTASIVRIVPLKYLRGVTSIIPILTKTEIHKDP